MPSNADGRTRGADVVKRNGPAPAPKVDGHVEAGRGRWRAQIANAAAAAGAGVRAELRAADDISLLLPGNRGDEYRRAGISTIRELARTDAAGEDRYLALLSVTGSSPHCA